MVGMIDAALQYVSRGFKVFPVKPDKTPYTPHGCKDCTMTQAGVKEYWSKWPDAGIGLVTDNLIVLDFDAAHGGLESKEALEKLYGEFPATRTHQTGGGGYHFLYRNPNGDNFRNTVKLGGYAGVDIRANGGYIIVPPSLHPSGNRYRVIDSSEIREAPVWLLAMLRQRPAVSTITTADGMIPEGQRDATLTSLGGTMRRRGMSQQAIESALMADNQTRCQPPLSDRDIARIAASVSKYQSDPLSMLPTENTEKTEQTETTENHCTSAEIHTDKVVWPLVDKWLTVHQGEKFSLDMVCLQMDIKTRDQRQSVAKKLAYEVGRGKLDKLTNARPPLYKYVDKTLMRMNWLEARSAHHLDMLRWPEGRDGSTFGWADHIAIPEKGLIVIAGVTNMGKSLFCRNFLWQNMDFYPCYYFSSETTEADFADYASRMSWADPIGAEGKPKFELIWREQDWADVIQPDAINIIDWLDLRDNFYQIGDVLKNIKSKLRTGIVLVAIQKDPNKDLGIGGMWSEHLASLYLTVDFGRMTVKKAKKWHDVNPNGKTYGFQIADAGARFEHLREVRKCKDCRGTGQGKAFGPCASCSGIGWKDVEEF